MTRCPRLNRPILGILGILALRLAAPLAWAARPTAPPGTNLRPVPLHLEVGDTMDVSTHAPAITRAHEPVTWTVRVPGIVRLTGKSPKTRAITALRAGRTTIQIANAAGLVLASWEVQVDPQPVRPVTDTAFRRGDRHWPVPPYFLGAQNTFPFSAFGHTPYFNVPLETTLAKELHLKSIRTGSNGYIFAQGDFITPADPLYKTYYGDTPCPWGDRVYRPPFPKIYPKDFFQLANNVGAANVFVLSILDQSLGALEAEVRNARSHSDGPLFLEMGNEYYDIKFQKAFPTVDAYITKCQAVYRMIKSIDPKIQVGIVGVPIPFEKRVRANPNNFVGDTAFARTLSQGQRIYGWNDALARHPDCYDAVILHSYFVTPTSDGITQRQLMRAQFVFAQEEYQGWLEAAQKFPGKQIWVTELGSFPNILGEPDAAEKARMTWSKTPGYAIGLMERIMNMMQSGVINLEESVGMNDRQGFGLYQPRRAIAALNLFDLKDLSDIIKLPNFYAVQELGEVLNQDPVFYKIDLAQGRVRQEAQVFAKGPHEPRYAMADAHAWGFGNEQGLKSLAILNRTDAPMRITLEGYDLKPVWVYGGRQEIFPKFLTNPIASGLWTDAPDIIPVPSHPEEAPARQIEVPAFSITVCEVSIHH